MRTLICLSVLFAAGCGSRLTPDDVRQLLDHPKGTVSKDTMARITQNIFQADKATTAEGIANILKTNQANPSGANAVTGVSAGALEDAEDVFCVSGLVASIASFDNCKSGDACHGDLTIDSCVLRIGHPGPDPDASGKIEFKIDATQTKQDLSLQFDSWQSTADGDDGDLDGIDGLITLESDEVTKPDAQHAEVVFAADVDTKLTAKKHDFFADGVKERDKVKAGLRFTADSDNSSDQGTLEILAFSDDNNDDSSVKISLHAQDHQVSASTVTASADLEVVGSNGTFTCNWSAADDTATADGDKITSSGECKDSNGKSFTFDGSSITEH